MISRSNKGKHAMIPLALIALTCVINVSAGEPFGRNFTYQGRLNLDGVPVNDSADLTFTLWDAETGGASVGLQVAFSNVPVVDGLFTVDIDFGIGAFNGDARWIRINARTPAGSGPYTTLSPRQPLMATPYSLQTRGLFVDDEGRVGIGTTEPEHGLHTMGDSILIERNGNEPALMIKNSTGGGNLRTIFGLNSAGYAYLTDGANHPVFYLSGQKAGVGGVGANEFSVNGSADVSGNFGIGTDAPADKLHVNGTAESVNIQLNKDNNTYASDLIFSGSGTQYNFGTPTADRLRVWNDNVGEVLTILPEGEVGIGTTSPSAMLDLNGRLSATSFAGEGSAVTNVTAQQLESAAGLLRTGNGVELYNRTKELDQANETMNNSSGNNELWQSFTAGISGELAAIEVWRATGGGMPGSAAIVRLYEGEGTSGALLGTSSLPPSIAAGWQSISFPSQISMVAGQQYTVRLSGTGQLWWRFNNPSTYSGGITSASPNWDFVFRTYVYGTFDHLMPAMIASPTGNIGIGTPSPASTLDVNGTLNATDFAGDGSGVVNVPGTWSSNGSGYYHEGNVVIGSTTPMDAALGVNGNVRMNNQDIKLRVGQDINHHGVGWYGDTKEFAGVAVDGPVLYGHQFGALGSTNGGNNLVLSWKYWGSVGIGVNDPFGMLDVRGDIAFGDSGQYFVPKSDREANIVVARIQADGTIDSNFTTSAAIDHVVKEGEGNYTVYFVDGTFSGRPVVSVTPCRTSGGSVQERVATIADESATSVKVNVRYIDQAAADGPFHFMAIGYP